MSKLIPISKRIDVTYAVCEKLHEWLGDVTDIAYGVDVSSGKGYRIYFDGRDVGTFNDLISGINKLFFDIHDSSWAKDMVSSKLKKRLRNNRKTRIIDIARLIIKYKVSFKYEQEAL